MAVASILLMLMAVQPLLLNKVQTQAITPVVVNSSVVGVTRSTDPQYVQDFSFTDRSDSEVGVGGQALHELRLQGINAVYNVELSTCEGSEFDTYLLVLNGNPSSGNSARVVAESANDIKCVDASERAFISARLMGGLYYIVVTGNGASSGTYNLTVTATLEPASKPVSWGLDRIDQRELPLDKKFDVSGFGQGTWFYLIDSGVRLTHEEFEERVEGGYDFVNNREDVHMDCTGHGTHVAGILAGKTYGVAKKARIMSLRVFGCDRRARTSSIINALDWAVYHWTRTGANGIIVISVNTKQPSQALTSMMESVFKRGMPVIAPAGDEAGSACDSLPASMESALTVGASDRLDRISSFSNSGNCTDMYAPGSEIVSAWHTGDYSTRVVSGSAQAAAHMGGVVSHLMALNEGLVQGKLVSDVIKSISTRNVLKGMNSSDNSRLAFVRSVPAFTGSAPEQLKVLLLCIIRANVTSCAEGSEVAGEIRRAFASSVEVSVPSVQIECRADDADGASALSKKLELRIEVDERRAAVKFGLLQDALDKEKKCTEEMSGIEFSVVEDVWAVDSRRIVFWGVPTFDSKQRKLSGGVISGIVVSVVCVGAVLLTAGCMWYRRARKLDEIETMEGSMDVARAPVEFDDYDDEDGQSKRFRSFRNAVRQASRLGSTHWAKAGMNRMSSYIGGEDRVQKELVNMQSFGGEAFAGVAYGDQEARSRSESSRSLSVGDEKPMASFRGWDNLVVRHERGVGNGGDNDEDDDDESVRMRSMGGEAFAVLGTMGSQRMGSVRRGAERSESRSMSSVRQEVLCGLKAASERGGEVLGAM
eukprot:TRINITY_DN1161_c0_g2_i1.p1 TRINITY_DN1161_c0_g2~~TRINITY_DN1161_c0_g2_i1.p1  ORF type:complete len:820 (-),score=130.93 TRINITY_DN1161_c0_g2_i1:96-2555(-)